MKDLFLMVSDLLRNGRLDDAVRLLDRYGFDDPKAEALAVLEVVNGDRYCRSGGSADAPWWL